MKNLEKIDEFLEASNKNVIDIIDGETGKILKNKLSAETIYDNYNSIEDLFKEFIGHNTLQIIKLQKNGSSYKRILPIIIAELVSKPKVSITESPMQTAPQPHINLNGMNGAENMFGMNGAQILSAVSKQMDYGRLEAAYERERNKNLNLEATVRDLAKKLSESELGLATADREKELDVKAVVNDQKSFVDSEIVKELVKQLPTILTAIKPAQTTAVGMGKPDVTLSSQKNSFIQFIKDNKVTDDMLSKLYITIKEMTTNQKFTTSYTQLLESFNLLKIV